MQLNHLLGKCVSRETRAIALQVNIQGNSRAIDLLATCPQGCIVEDVACSVYIVMHCMICACLNHGRIDLFNNSGLVISPMPKTILPPFFSPSLPSPPAQTDGLQLATGLPEGCGVTASQAFKEGQTVCRVPLSAMMTLQTAIQATVSHQLRW